MATLRTRGSKVTGMPPEVVKCIDEAIAILKARQQLAAAPIDQGTKRNA